MPYCGTYVGGAGASIYNRASELMIARESGDRTTLTLKNDFEGDLDDFALIIPVPEVLDAEDVRAVDLDAFTQTDAYGAPRIVEYTCEDVVEQYRESDPPRLGCGVEYMYTADNAAGDALLYDESTYGSGVNVENLFDVVEYEIAILSAKGGQGLESWLQVNGYELPVGGADLFQEYIDGGSYFLAAKINADKMPEGRNWLSPL